MDLTSEQMRRNYSVDDLQKWDKSRYPLPPIGAMKGNFRYRHSAAADPEWRKEYFHKQVYGLDGANSMLSKLDMKDTTGISDEEWQTLAAGGPRRGSAVSSISARTVSTTSLGETAEPQAGVRVFRGFSPSRSSSTRSSFHSRKNSSLSVMNLPPEVEASLPKLQRQPTGTPSERRTSGGLLSTINEVQSTTTAANTILNKLAKPCDFTDKGDPDSAVASEDEDEAWSDVAETQPARVSAITQMLKEGKKPESQLDLTRVRTTSSDKSRGRGSTASIDRSKTIRQNRAHSGRRQSRGKITARERVKSDEKKNHIREEMPRLPAADTFEDDGSELTMHIRQPAKELKEQRPKQAGGKTRTDDSTLIAENQQEYLPRAPRNRSTTTLL
ncbi:hypothetical protein PMZ80_010062 [Knufia obscura]|nr:hypothetical protein PMZ80_010062 [Knufia obscura]